jgi:lipoprotein-anchoring transpeptidase ErfK/SrfK
MPAFSFSRLINLAGAVLIGSATLLGAGRAEAASQMVARISISTQRMLVLVDGREAFSWKVSTAGRGYSTPTGTFRPTRLHEMWYSRQYDNAPMPHSVFFFQGYAVHATDAVKKLGRPASHGCVRLHPDNASDFFTLVETFGIANTAIVITE